MKKLAIASLACVFLTGIGNATTLTFDYTTEFSGAFAPAGDPLVEPWLTATFDDGGSPGTVALTIDTGGLTGSEFLRAIYFNFDTDTITDLAISAPSGVTASIGVDAFKADGDGLYDILLTLPTRKADRLGADKSLTITFTGTGLTASDFDYMSAPDGGSGPFPTAAHVQGIGDDGQYSGWVTVPEPSTLSLLALSGLFGFVAMRRRKK